jgi:hypothetical protein
MKKKLMSVYEDCGCLVFLLCCVLALGLVFGVYCLQGWIFMLLWNWLAVTYLSAVVLPFWPCVGIVWALHFLGKIIFGRTTVECNND